MGWVSSPTQRPTHSLQPGMGMESDERCDWDNIHPVVTATWVLVS